MKLNNREFSKRLQMMIFVMVFDQSVFCIISDPVFCIISGFTHINSFIHLVPKKKGRVRVLIRFQLKTNKQKSDCVILDLLLYCVTHWSRFRL